MLKYQLLVLLGAGSYGVLSTIVVLAYDHGYGLAEVVGSQLLIGTMLTWLLALVSSRLQKRKLAQQPKALAAHREQSKMTWKQRLLLLMAGIPTGATGLLYYSSLKYISASLAIVMLFQFTWIGILIQSISRRKRPDNRVLGVLGVLLVGTVFAAGVLQKDSGQFQMLGIALGLLSAVSYSLFVFANDKVATSAPSYYRSAWMMTGALIFTYVILPPEFLFDGKLWGMLLLFGFLLGLFGAFIPPVLFAVGVPRVGGGMAGVLGAVELPVAVLMSTFVLSEHVTLLQWAGVVLVLAGVALPELLRSRTAYRRQHASSSLS